MDDVIVDIMSQHVGAACAYTGSGVTLDRANALNVERDGDKLALDKFPVGRYFSIAQGLFQIHPSDIDCWRQDTSCDPPARAPTARVQGTRGSP